MSQIVAEELGIAAEEVHIVQPDTDVTPYDTITAGSRSTYHMGNAVRMAAAKVKAALCDMVASKLEVDPDDLVAGKGRIYVRGLEERGELVQIRDRAGLSGLPAERGPYGSRNRPV